MRVTFDRVPTFDAILADGNFKQVVELAAADSRALVFLSRCVRNYRDEAQAAGPVGALTFAAIFAAGQPDAATLGVQLERVAELLLALYRDHTAAHVRGALVEGVVKRGLASRYSSHELDDNVFVGVANGYAFRSKTTVDVAGWDGAVGECHDCKVKVGWIVKDVIDDLDNGLPYSRFRIGVVTTDSRPAALGILRRKGLRLSRRTVVIELDGVWNALPLNAAT